MKFATTCYIALCMLATSISAHAQSLDYTDNYLPSTATGRFYVLTFPSPLTNLYDSRFPSSLFDNQSLAVMVYSDHPTVLDITANGSQWSRTVVLSGGKFDIIELPVTNASFVQQDYNSLNSFTLRSRDPVLLYSYMTTAFGSEAWTPLPVESWGKEYYVSAIPAETIQNIEPFNETNYLSETKGAPSQIIITAARDNTQVTITPNDAVSGFGREPFTITLQAGQSYMVRSEVNLEDPEGLHGPDLGGTRIVADNLIGVVTGNTRASMIGTDALSRNSFKGLMMEALAPVEQHGTEFIYTPTWDAQRPDESKNPTPTDGIRLAEYARIYGTTNGRTFGTVTDPHGGYNRFDVRERNFHSEKFSYAQAHSIRTDQPSQAMMHSSSVVKFNGTTTHGNNNYFGSSYTSWTPYMVELIPREQWTNSAAFHLPVQPHDLVGYLNLVAPADQASNIFIRQADYPWHAFSFNRGRIPGTNLVWGTIPVNDNKTYLIRGDEGAQFTGFVYGNSPGEEVFRPGRTKKEKGDSPLAVHPSEYEEQVGVSFGYPLTPLRRVLAESDEIVIEPDLRSHGLYSVHTINPNPVGFRSIGLAPGAVNAELEIIGVQDITDIIGMSQAVVRIRPIITSQDATATIVVTDRTGKETSLSYTYPTVISGTNETEAPGITARLEMISPNPFAGNAVFALHLAKTAPTRVTITDALGKEVATVLNRNLAAGEHILEWSATTYPAGMYFCTVTSGSWKAIERLILR